MLNIIKTLVCFFIAIILVFKRTSSQQIDSKLCNSNKPVTSNDCLSRETTNNYSKCCYLENFNNQDKKMCLEIPNISLFYSDLYQFNNELYKIQCDLIPKKNLLANCGTGNSTDKSDCSVYSSFVESCCFNLKDKNCYNLGMKYSGDIQWAGMSLSCGADFIKYNNISSIILWIYFILLIILY